MGHVPSKELIQERFTVKFNKSGCTEVLQLVALASVNFPDGPEDPLFKKFLAIRSDPAVRHWYGRDQSKYPKWSQIPPMPPAEFLYKRFVLQADAILEKNLPLEEFMPMPVIMVHCDQETGEESVVGYFGCRQFGACGDIDERGAVMGIFLNRDYFNESKSLVIMKAAAKCYQHFCLRAGCQQREDIPWPPAARFDTLEQNLPCLRLFEKTYQLYLRERGQNLKFSSDEFRMNHANGRVYVKANKTLLASFATVLAGKVKDPPPFPQTELDGHHLIHPEKAVKKTEGTNPELLDAVVGDALRQWGASNAAVVAAHVAARGGQQEQHPQLQPQQEQEPQQRSRVSPPSPPNAMATVGQQQPPVNTVSSTCSPPVTCVHTMRGRGRGPTNSDAYAHYQIEDSSSSTASTGSASASECHGNSAPLFGLEAVGDRSSTSTGTPRGSDRSGNSSPAGPRAFVLLEQGAVMWVSTKGSPTAPPEWLMVGWYAGKKPDGSPARVASIAEQSHSYAGGVLLEMHDASILQGSSPEMATPSYPWELLDLRTESLTWVTSVSPLFCIREREDVCALIPNPNGGSHTSPRVPAGQLILQVPGQTLTPPSQSPPTATSAASSSHGSSGIPTGTFANQTHCSSSGSVESPQQFSHDPYGGSQQPYTTSSPYPSLVGSTGTVRAPAQTPPNPSGSGRGGFYSGSYGGYGYGQHNPGYPEYGYGNPDPSSPPFPSPHGPTPGYHHYSPPQQHQHGRGNPQGRGRGRGY